MIFNLILFHFLFIGLAKKFLIKTKQHMNKTEPQLVGDEAHNDYMADIHIQSVDVGKPVTLKCNSPKEFSRCFFAKNGQLFYKIEPKVSYQNDRLQCLCDVSLKMISTT